MLNELLSIFRQGNPLRVMGEDFAEMLKIASEMTIQSGDFFFRNSVSPEERTQIYKRDVKVNKLERRIRKQVVTHLSAGGNSASIPYCLLLMSLVKDVERLGDYAKNLTEIIDIYPGDLPDDDIFAELQELRAGIDEALRDAPSVFQDSDRERALVLIREGKDQAKRADGLLMRIAKADYDAGQSTALVLGARYYKRIGGHLLNLLSAVVMPLHKIDYYDEDEVPADKG